MIFHMEDRILNVFVMILIIVGLGVFGILYMLFEAMNVQINHLVIKKEKNGDNKAQGDHPHLLRIMNITDMHIEHIMVNPKSVKRSLIRFNPDVILFCGDYISEWTGIKKLKLFLDKSGMSRYRCIGVMGNHDFESIGFKESKVAGFVKKFRDLGIEILNDESVTIEKNGNRYNIIGLKEMKGMNPDVEKTFSHIDKISSTNIVMVHNPDMVFRIPKEKTDLILAGHFHGGQIWLPFRLEYTILRGEKLCHMGITKGLHEIEGNKLYINRGLGNVVVPMRFLSRPEILFVDI